MNVFTSIVLRSHFLAKATDSMAEMTMTTPTMMLKKNNFILSWISYITKDELSNKVRIVKYILLNSDK